MTYPVYTTGLRAALLLYAPAALARRIVRGVPLHLRARLGWGIPAGNGPVAWVHAVSVGEAIAAAPLIHGLRRLYPALPLVVTTVTDTGARVVRDRFDGVATHRFFPLDFPTANARVVSSINPAFLICMETELWPNLLRLLARRGVPVMIANGRLSDRSFRRYRVVRHFMRRVLADVRVFAMQSDEDARRMIALGADAERVFVTGNVKTEPVPVGSGSPDLWRRLLGLQPGDRVWIAGSTHKGEEEAVLDAHAAARARCPDLALVLAPRHPERVPDVLRLAEARGFQALRRSTLPGRRNDDAIIVLDTVGELSQLYAVADVVFVGGSLVSAGGHNMLEPALHRKPVLFGPHTQNFRESAALLLESGGAELVGDGPALSAALARLLADEDLRRTRGQAAFEAVAGRSGAVRETLDLVARFLHPEA